MRAAYTESGDTGASAVPASQRGDDADELFVVFDDADAESMWHTGGLKRKAVAAKQVATGQTAAAAAAGLVAGTADDVTAVLSHSISQSGAAQHSLPGAPADAATAGGAEPQSAGMPAIPGLEDSGDDVILGNVIGMPAEGRAGAATPDPTAAGASPGAVVFPGVNAPIPEGADPARWETAQNVAANGLHGSQGASQRGMKRSFQLANESHAGGAAAPMAYGGLGHNRAGNAQRPHYHYHVRNPEPAPPPQSAPLLSPSRPSLFASRLAPRPDVQLPPQPYSGFAAGSAGLRVQQHQNGYAAGHPGHPSLPPDAAHQHGLQAAAYAQQVPQQHHSYAQHSYAQPSYPQPSPSSVPFPGTPAGSAWQQTAQWQAPQTIPMYRTRQ